MEDWKEYKLGDIATFKYGTMPKKEKISENGLYPIYSGYRIVGKYDEYNILDSELIIVARGVGGTGDVKLSPKKCFLTNLSIVAYLNEEILLKKYAYYYFSLHNLRYLDSGSAQSQITISDLAKLKLHLPPLPTQQKIAQILSSLDDKIELNNKINANLEQQAQALFKSWFVDFEPFGGEMPAGWRVGKLSEIAEITMGQSPDGKSYNEDGVGTVFYQGRAEFGSRFPTRRLFTTDPRRIAKKYDILMSVRAPVGDTNIAHEDCCIGRGLAAIHSNDNHQSFVYYTVLSLEKQLDIFNGEGTVFGCINKDGLNNLEVVIPSKDDMDKFEKIVASLDADIYNRSEENRRLMTTRDTLLPKLMSGEILVHFQK